MACMISHKRLGILGGHFDDFKSRFTADQIIEGDVVAKGSFRDDDRGQDFLHRGSGTVSIKVVDGKRFVQLESDFTSTPGPDYHVYVSSLVWYHRRHQAEFLTRRITKKYIDRAV